MEGPQGNIPTHFHNNPSLIKKKGNWEVYPWGVTGVGDFGKLRKRPFVASKITYIPNFMENEYFLHVLLSYEVCAFSSVMSPGRLFVNGCCGYRRVNLR